MISSAEIQSAYVNLYRNIRNYIWDFKTVECLAELEIAVYTSFPDITDVRNKFNQLYIDIRSQFEEDEEFKKAAEEFKELIEKDETFYSKIDSVKEVITP